MIAICLVNSTQVVLVDYRYYTHLIQWDWYLNNTGYAIRREGNNRKGLFRQIAMHRTIMGLSYKDSKQCDHIDGNRLNNQMYNLRIVTPLQNASNRQKHKNSTSIYKGVYWRNNQKRWIAAICYNYLTMHIGSFTDELEAAKAYNTAAIKYFGEFARLNVITEEVK